MFAWAKRISCSLYEQWQYNSFQRTFAIKVFNWIVATCGWLFRSHAVHMPKLCRSHVCVTTFGLIHRFLSANCCVRIVLLRSFFFIWTMDHPIHWLQTKYKLRRQRLGDNLKHMLMFFSRFFRLISGSTGWKIFFYATQFYNWHFFYYRFRFGNNPMKKFAHNLIESLYCPILIK